LSEAWIQVSKKILKRLKHLEETKGKDRLELVRSLRFVLSVIHRSLLGWMQWVNDPDVMTLFTEKELGEMTENLSKLTQSFVEYDLKATSLGVKKGLKTPKKVAKNKREDRTRRFYV
jgi:hypothetical protein